MEAFSNFVDKVDSFVWGPAMLVLLVGTGVFLTFRLGFQTWRNLGYSLKSVFSKEALKKSGEGDVSMTSFLSEVMLATDQDQKDEQAGPKVTLSSLRSDTVVNASLISSLQPSWFIASCQKIKYLFPRAHATAYVMMALRIAWFKVYRPAAYYAAYYTIRAKAFDYELMAQGQAHLLDDLDAVCRELLAEHRKKEQGLPEFISFFDPSEDNYFDEKNKVQHLDELILAVACRKQQAPAAFSFYFANAGEKDKEVALYIAMHEVTENFGTTDDTIAVYDYAVQKREVKPRDELREWYEELKKGPEKD